MTRRATRLGHRALRSLCQGQSQRRLRERAPSRRVPCALTKLARPPRELPLGHGRAHTRSQVLRACLFPYLPKPARVHLLLLAYVVPHSLLTS
ncbi:hypothetical protein FB451DRAFT_1371193 [Mycena latifolia]|nr:hypothetical protein FB451DRAFT_1371193 [Mycena latifolia]